MSGFYPKLPEHVRWVVATLKIEATPKGRVFCRGPPNLLDGLPMVRQRCRERERESERVPILWAGHWTGQRRLFAQQLSGLANSFAEKREAFKRDRRGLGLLLGAARWKIKRHEGIRPNLENPANSFFIEAFHMSGTSQAGVSHFLKGSTGREASVGRGGQWLWAQKRAVSSFGGGGASGVLLAR